MTVEIRSGDCRDVLATLPAASVRCCVTSPPYFGLRDYGVPGQIGLEQTPAEYIAALVEVFRHVRRVLADDGTVWLNIGDSYCSTDKWGGGGNIGKQTVKADGSVPSWAVRQRKAAMPGIKPKDLLMIPARVALALQADGWWLRSSIVWHKPNPMPESVRDRPTSAHESVFLLAKAERYYYDAKAIAETALGTGGGVVAGPDKAAAMGITSNGTGATSLRSKGAEFRNARNVWTIATQPYAGAHCAVMPPALAERCIQAGSAVGDTILDPFFGAGTTGLVADRLGRNCIGIELNPASAAEARARIGLMATSEAAD
jgi:DNA modification methylase